MFAYAALAQDRDVRHIVLAHEVAFNAGHETFIQKVKELDVRVLTQGTNVNSKFPQNTNSGFVGGISVTAAYPINAVMDVVGTLSYHNFGKVKTGTTGTPAPSGMNAGERLESSLAVTSIGIGVRYSF